MDIEEISVMIAMRQFHKKYKRVMALDSIQNFVSNNISVGIVYVNLHRMELNLYRSIS